MVYKMIQVGTGGQGTNWCSTCLPPNIEDGLIEVIAAVDIDPEQHIHAQKHLGLSEDQCFKDVEAAFTEYGDAADFCTIVVPPWIHEKIVDIALAYDLHILSEKPIADTLEASARIAEKVKAAGMKMGITMSHRFDQDKTSFRRRVESTKLGPISYLVGRFTCNARSYGAWGAFRHEMEDVLLIEGAVHQLDFIADMAGSPCKTLYADTWLPEWAEYDGDVQALVQMRFENGVRATWEGAKANAVTLNGWGSDYLRAECKNETLVLNDREITRYPYEHGAEAVSGGLNEVIGDPIEIDEQEKWSNTWLVEQFIEWLDGGEKMVTNIEDNLQSMALVEAAIQSSQSGAPVAVQKLLSDVRRTVDIG